MTWNRFKNNKTISVIGTLLPITLIIIGAFFIDYMNNATHIVYVILSLFITVGYVIIIIAIDVTWNVYILPFRSKIIYSKYGTYFLIRKRGRDVDNDTLVFNLFTNKYWIFLSKISKDGDNLHIWSTSDVNNLADKIHVKLEKVYDKELDKKKLQNSFNEWDGITDDVIRREKTIENVLK